MLDLHAHILPGLDDGVRTVEEALELARASVDDGVTTIAATPHVREDYPTTARAIEAGAAELRRHLRSERIPLVLVTGGEVALERLQLLDDEELQALTLAQTGRYLLLEFPDFGWPLALDAAVDRLLRRGIVPVLAHPERNSEIRERPRRLAAVVDAGALVQMTAMSLDGRAGRRAAAVAVELLQLRLVHLLATDAHAPHVRAGGLGAACAAIRDDELAGFLVRDAPAAILAGDDVGAPPALGRRRPFAAFRKRV